MAAFLNKEAEAKKEKAINIVKNFGYDIQEVDINKSGKSWSISSDGKFIQPLTSIKGLGEKALEQILEHRPFKTVEDFLFNDDISYSKLNKKALEVLVRSRSCDFMFANDKRFKHARHFWLAAVNDRPRSKEKLDENILKYGSEPNFTEEEYINLSLIHI